MQGKKLLVLHSGVFELPDDFQGGYREALMSMLEHHLLIEDGKLTQTMTPVLEIGEKEQDVHSKIISNQIASLWKDDGSKVKFCGSMTLHEWVEVQPNQFILVQINRFEGKHIDNMPA